MPATATPRALAGKFLARTLAIPPSRKNYQLLRRGTMKRLTSIAATAAAAASIILLASGTPVSAQPQSNTLHILSTALLLTGPTTPAAGDHYEFYDRDTGDTRGNDYFDCVVTNPHGDTICNAEFVLKGGNISIEGVFNANATKVDTSAVITGGTGRYNAASGTAIATGSPTSTNFAFHFAR
jgi:hypothetical protein